MTGLLNFFHDYLRQAVEKRYLPNIQQQQRYQNRLAQYFMNQKEEVASKVSREEKERNKKRERA